MQANFNLYINKPGEITYLLILIATAFASKYLAAIISKLVFKTSFAETNLLFGLSTSRAASAIAIILIGLNFDLVSESVLNNTVILILVTSITSSYITQRSGKKLLISENDTTSRDKKRKHKLLVPVANPANMENLLDFATLIKEDNDELPIYPLSVFTNRQKVREQIDEKQKQIIDIIDSMQSDIPFETNTRIDSNVTNGIIRAAEEIVASAIILGWNDRHTPLHILFGNVLNNLLAKTQRMLLVIKTPSTFREIKKITLFCNENAQYEPGFSLWLDSVLHLAKNLQVKIMLNCPSEFTQEAIRQHLEKNKALKYIEPQNLKARPSRQNKENKSTPSELFIFVSSRRKTVSYSRQFEHTMNNSITRFKRNNIIIIYPEQ